MCCHWGDDINDIITLHLVTVFSTCRTCAMCLRRVKEIKKIHVFSFHGVAGRLWVLRGVGWREGGDVVRAPVVYGVLKLWYSVCVLSMWVLCISKDLAFAKNQWALIYNSDAHFSVYLSLVSSFCSTNSTASPHPHPRPGGHAPPMSYVSGYQCIQCNGCIQGERVGEVIFSSSGMIIVRNWVVDCHRHNQWEDTELRSPGLH